MQKVLRMSLVLLILMLNSCANTGTSSAPDSLRQNRIEQKVQMNSAKLNAATTY